MSRADINLARLDLVTIQLAVLCTQTGSLSAAARLACCSVSAGSQRLSSLEASLGKTLFVRDHKGMQPTQAGRLFVLHAQAILDRVDLMKAQLGADVSAPDRDGLLTPAT